MKNVKSPPPQNAPIDQTGGIDSNHGQRSGEVEVLLVEDNFDDAALFQHFMTDSCRVSFARTGAEAFDRLFQRGQFGAKAQPNVVVLDVNIPILSGYAVLNILKRDPVLRKIPVVVWSGSANPNDIEKAFEMGACGYMRKSSDLADVEESLTAFASFWGNHVLYPQGSNGCSQFPPNGTPRLSLSVMQVLPSPKLRRRPDSA